ncbi:chemotaxis protein CheY [Pseudomonas koreensis]|uniref:chemotaxis protein CheY n=1 Tax=Pseudomonas atacamensis TaxID=2565368 RepID=UPI000D8A0A33|nr:chemotaxis protein CheY [Pseudomonas atacamensis]MDH2077254.1 chemotaxis protein CheY [Pseudomonas atacamensis]PYB83653.1 chemotaxis protein CheY [Pseudomonas koreensis]WKV85526.1 chemotaxis protein CheY [Pseudomonas sp. B24_DOA]WKV86963.1 chemotaxis protein CheY [Pseudomonas sp. B21_DOA]
MSNKALRILIADPQHFHRMKIERLFNALGYYRVAPVQTLGELLTLVDYGCEPFDVLVINAELAAGSLDLLGFLLDNPQVRHALIYNEQSAPLQALAGFAQESAQISPTPLPNLQLIGQVMARVEARDERQAPPDSHASLRHANA